MKQTTNLKRRIRNSNGEIEEHDYIGVILSCFNCEACWPATIPVQLMVVYECPVCHDTVGIPRSKFIKYEETEH